MSSSSVLPPEGSIASLNKITTWEQAFEDENVEETSGELKISLTKLRSKGKKNITKLFNQNISLKKTLETKTKDPEGSLFLHLDSMEHRLPKQNEIEQKEIMQE